MKASISYTEGRKTRREDRKEGHLKGAFNEEQPGLLSLYSSYFSAILRDLLITKYLRG
jgi:hypothetical protein